MHIFGTHAIDIGGIDMAARRSANAGLNALQIFTAIPKFYGDKSSIRADRVSRFRNALEETKILPGRVLVHAAYVLNAALRSQTLASIASERLEIEMPQDGPPSVLQQTLLKTPPSGNTL